MIHESGTQSSYSIVGAPSHPYHQPNDAYYKLPPPSPQQEFYEPIVHQQAYPHTQHRQPNPISSSCPYSTVLFGTSTAY